MKVTEIVQPKSPEQQRIDTLKVNKEKASSNLAAERKRQQVAKAHKALTTANQIKTITPSVP